MTKGEGQNKDRQPWHLRKCLTSRFVTTALKVHEELLLLCNPCINRLALLFCLSSLVNTTKYFIFTYCSVLPLTCSIHCLGFLERHTSVFLVLIFFSAWSHTE